MTIYIYIICPQVSSATPKIPSFWGQKSSFLCCCSTFHMFLIWGHSLSPASFIWFTGSSASLISLQLAVNRLLLEPKTYRYPKWWHPPPGSSRLVNDLNELLVKKQYWLPYIHCLSPTMLIALVMLWSNHFSIWAARQSLELCPFPAATGHLGFAARGWNYQCGFSLRISGGRSPIYTSNLRKGSNESIPTSLWRIPLVSECAQDVQSKMTSSTQDLNRRKPLKSTT